MPLEPPPTYMEACSRPPGYTATRAHHHCPTCTCLPRTRRNSDAEWASPAHKLIRIHFFDSPYSEEYTELHFPLDEDGYLDYEKLAKTLGVKEVVRKELLGRLLVQTALREPADLIRRAMWFKQLTIVEFSRCQTEPILYSESLTRLNVQVHIRWYPSPTSDIALFEETFEDIDLFNCLSLGRIARKHGILNVQIFDPCTMKRLPTNFMHVLFPRERARVRGNRPYIAITDAAVPLPMEGIDNAQLIGEAGSPVFDTAGRLVGCHFHSKLTTNDEWRRLLARILGR